MHAHGRDAQLYSSHVVSTLKANGTWSKSTLCLRIMTCLESMSCMFYKRALRHLVPSTERSRDSFLKSRFRMFCKTSRDSNYMCWQSTLWACCMTASVPTLSSAVSVQLLRIEADSAIILSAVKTSRIGRELRIAILPMISTAQQL